VSASAQVNTEKMRLGLTESGIVGQLELTYELVRGNSELTSIGFSPNVVWRSGNFQTFTLNDVTRVQDSDGSIINKGFSHLRFNYFLSKKVVAEIFLQAQYDHSQDLSHRYLIGSGLRFLPVKKDSFLVAIGVAAMYERERLSSGEKSDLIRSSNYLSVNIVRGLLTFNNAIYFQPAFKDFKDARLLIQTGLEVKIIKNLSLTTSLHYFHDSRPPKGIRYYDLAMKNGLSFSF
jgi:hypothetical protein